MISSYIGTGTSKQIISGSKEHQDKPWKEPQERDRGSKVRTNFFVLTHESSRRAVAISDSNMETIAPVKHVVRKLPQFQTAPRNKYTMYEVTEDKVNTL